MANNQLIISGELLQGFLTSEVGLVGYIDVPSVVGIESYDGEYVVNPNFVEQILETKYKMMKDDVVIEPITVSKTTNPSGGNTVYIGGVYNG